MRKRYLWKFSRNRRSQNYNEGLFVATEQDVIGCHCAGEFTKIDLDPDMVEKVENVLGDTWSGYNPLEDLSDEDEDYYFDLADNDILKRGHLGLVQEKSGKENS